MFHENCFAPRQFIITSGIFTRLSQSPFPETKVTSMVHALQVVVMLSHKDNYDNLSSYSKTHNLFHPWCFSTCRMWFRLLQNSTALLACRVLQTQRPVPAVDCCKISPRARSLSSAIKKVLFVYIFCAKAKNTCNTMQQNYQPVFVKVAFAPYERTGEIGDISRGNSAQWKTRNFYLKNSLHLNAPLTLWSSEYLQETKVAPWNGVPNMPENELKCKTENEP